MSHFWENPLLGANPRPKDGQKIKLRVGWKAPGTTGGDMWITCRVDAGSRGKYCTGVRDGNNYVVPAKRWRKGERRPGRMWKPA